MCQDNIWRHLRQEWDDGPTEVLVPVPTINFCPLIVLWRNMHSGVIVEPGWGGANSLDHTHSAPPLLLVSDECLSGVISVSPPLSWDVGWDGIRCVQCHPLTGIVTQGTEHRLEVWNIALRTDHKGTIN